MADVSTPFGHYIDISENGKVNVRGVDYGPKVSFHGESRHHLILKIGGHTAWCSRGQTAYYAGRFAVFSIKSKVVKAGVASYTVEPLVEFTQKQGTR